MARFVASEVSRMSREAPADSGELSSNNTSISLPDSVETASSTGSVIRIGVPGGAAHLRVDWKDSQTSSLGSLGQPDDSSSMDDREAPTSHSHAFAMHEEIHAPVETVPPPLEFQNSRDEEEEEEEEVVTVTEEYIMPMGPGGPDYTAAIKVQQEDEVKAGKSSGVFRAEPVSILKRVEREPKLEVEEKPKPSKPAKKEEFVLTLEDLSSVSLLPDRPKVFAPPKLKVYEPQPEPEPEVEREEFREVASVSAPGRSHVHLAYVSDHGHVQPAASPEDRYQPSEQTSKTTNLSSFGLPTMRYTSNTEPLPFSDDDRSSQSSSDHVYRSTATVTISGSNSVKDDASDMGSEQLEDPDSRQLVESSPSRQGAQLELQRQYNEMQEQLGVWQRQLERNQALLAAQNSAQDGGGYDDSGYDDDQRQSIESQVAQGLQIIESVRQSMQALQLKQQQQNGTAQRSASPPPPPPPPATVVPAPPPAPEPTVAKAVTSAVRAQAKPKSKPLPSRFQPQLDPREELMIAIRSFGGRAGLNTVSVLRVSPPSVC
jgi:hypothetical protein